MVASSTVEVLASAAYAAVRDRFAGLDVLLIIEGADETIMRDPLTNVQTLVPVVTHGAKLTGSVVLTPPPGYARSFGGLTMTLHTAKVKALSNEPQIPSWMPQPDPVERRKADEKKHLELEKLPVVAADGKAGVHIGCKADRVFFFETVYATEHPKILLEPRQYDVNKEPIVVPFSFPTAALPPVESLELDVGVGLVHWVQVRVDWLGWRGWYQWALESRRVIRQRNADTNAHLQKEGGVMALMTKNQDPMLAHAPPYGDAHCFFALQVVGDTPVAAPADPASSEASADGPAAEPAVELDAVVAEGKAKAKVATEAVVKAAAEAVANAASMAQCLEVSDFGATCLLDVLRPPHLGVVLGEGAVIKTHLQLNGTKMLSAVELRLRTSVDGADPPLTTRKLVVWSSDGTGVAYPGVVWSSEDETSIDETSIGPTLDLDVDMALEPADGFGALQLCRSLPKLQLDVRMTPVDEMLTIHCEVTHTLEVRLVDKTGATASKSVPVVLTRSVTCGAPVGELLPTRPELKPRKPLIVRVLISIAVFVLAWASTLIVLSFMMPVKMEYAYEYIDLREEAVSYGFLPNPDKNATGYGGTFRSFLASGTQSLKRFLTGVR